MTRPDPALHPTLIDLIKPLLHQQGIPTSRLSSTLHLIDSGLMDSLQLLEFIALIQDDCGVTFDLFDVDPEQLATLEGLNDLLMDHLPPK